MVSESEAEQETIIIKPTLSARHSSGEIYKRGESPGSKQLQRVKKPKKALNACLTCRNRHIKCPGGSPCANCQSRHAVCEYSEPKKKVVASMKYLMDLQDHIANLKRENIELSRQLSEYKSSTQNHVDFTKDSEQINAVDPKGTSNNKLSDSEDDEEIASSFAQRNGRLINSTLNQTYFVGSSSMTLFGLEIESLISKYLTAKEVKPLPTSSVSPPTLTESQNTSSSSGSYFDLKKVTSTHNHFTSESLPSDNLSISIEQLNSEPPTFQFVVYLPLNDSPTTLQLHFPTYSYALLLMDTFLTYFDGCFYFFNEGFEKTRLKQLYSQFDGFKGILNGDSILQAIWFVKIFVIFGLGETYLGTKSLQDKIFTDKFAKNYKNSDIQLPGMEFFNQASQLFHYIDCNESIECSVREGSIETLLLYALFLQVADRTIASYFYFGQALRACLLLGMHVDSQSDTLPACELEHHRRLWWTVYMFERMSSSKAGLPLGLTDNTISTELPQDIKVDNPNYIFSRAEAIANCVKIVRINAKILNQMYQRQPSSNILPIIQNIFKQLIQWRNQLSDFSQVDFSQEDDKFKISRVATNLFTEYFQGINLLIRPLLFHFTSIQLKRFKNNNTYLNLESYSNTITTLLNFSLQASVNTIRSIWHLMGKNLLSIFGYMDREYLFTSCCTLLLFNTAFGIHEQTYIYLDQALTIFTLMQNSGNRPSELRRAQLLTLMINLDFHDTLHDLILKHSKDDIGTLFPSSIGKSVPNAKSEATKKESLSSISNSNNGNDSILDDDDFIPHNNHVLINESNNNSNSKEYMGGTETSLDSLSDMINVTLQQAYIAPPLTELGSEIVAKNVDQLDLHDTAPLMSLDEMLNDINHVSSSDTQLWKEISDQAMWLGDTMDPASAVRTDMYYSDVLNK
ncbi:proline utilization trans-activator [Monosporozyma servazzii]